MLSEITIIVKDESQTLRQKFLEYETFECDPEHPILKQHIEATRKNFKGNDPDIQIKISMVI